jgi:hypothetical protein
MQVVNLPAVVVVTAVLLLGNTIHFSKSIWVENKKEKEETQMHMNIIQS